MIDDNTEKAFLRLAQRLIEEAVEWVKKDKHAIVSKFPVIIKNTGWRRISISTIDYYRLFDRKIAEIYHWPEARECAEEHYKAGTFRHFIAEIERERLDRYGNTSEQGGNSNHLTLKAP